MKIIHVDENRFARYEMEKDVLRVVSEAELHCFDNPDTALKFAEAEGCDVLLTEIELWNNRLGGIRLAKAMKEINPRVNIIFVTVYDENEVARETSGLAISGFIPKLWTLEQLAAAFHNLRYPVQTHTTI